MTGSTIRTIVALASALLLICCDTPRDSNGGGSSSNNATNPRLPSMNETPIYDRYRTRVLSYNVRNCKGTDDVVDYDRIAKIIDSLDAEAVALQELDSMTARYPGVDLSKILGEKTGMHATFGAAIDYRGGKYGVAILTKEPPLSHYTVALPCSKEPRVMLVVELEKYYICTTHFSLDADYRKQGVDIIVEEAKRLDKPLFLAGDMNASRSELSMATLANHFDIVEKEGSPYTFPSDKPSREIDYICLYRNSYFTYKILSHKVCNIPTASDHRPLILDIEVEE